MSDATKLETLKEFGEVTGWGRAFSKDAALEEAARLEKAYPNVHFWATEVNPTTGYWRVDAALKKQVGDESAALYSTEEIVEDREEVILREAEKIIQKRMTRGQSFTSPSDAGRYLKIREAQRESEAFGILFLDNKHRLISDEIMFYGTVDGAAVYVREVVKRALANNAAAIILYHNHPSGVPTPSEADRAITRRISDGLSLVDVRVLDHVVVAAEGFVSMAERGEV